MWVPNWWLKMLMHELPHDGVAALAVPAVSAPATPTPPTRVSVAAAASTLLLMDIGENSSLGTRSHTLRTAAPSWPRSTRRILARSLGTLPAHGWPDQDRNGRPDRSCSLRGKDPGSPEVCYRFRRETRGTGLPAAAPFVHLLTHQPQQ